MSHKGFQIVELNRFLSNLPGEVDDRKGCFPSIDVVLVFKGSVFIGAFPSIEAAERFIDDLIARQVDAVEYRAEYDRYLKTVSYQDRLFLKVAAEHILDIEGEVEELENSSTFSPR